MLYRPAGRHGPYLVADAAASDTADAASDTADAASATADAASEAASAAGAVTAGAGAGAGAGASSFLPQALSATAATRDAHRSDFFIDVLNML